MKTKWKKLREGHWVSWNGYEILKSKPTEAFKDSWFLFDTDGVPVEVEGRCSWATLRGAQRAFLAVQSQGEALAARHIKIA